MSLQHLVRIVVGLALVAALVRWFGADLVWHQLVALRWVALVLMFTGLVKHALRTLAWQAGLAADGVPLSFVQLFRVRITAQGAAYVSGLDLLVSEPLKPWLLRHVAPVNTTIATTMVEASVYWVVSLLITAVGGLLAVATLTDSHYAVLGAGVAIGALGLAAMLLSGQIPQIPRLSGFIERRRAITPRWSAILRQAGDAEARMRSFRVRHPGTARQMLGFNLLVQVVMLGEVWAVLTAVGLSIAMSQLFMIEAASRLVKMASFYLPARLGADEAGAAGAFALMGLDPSAGLALAFARRIQAFSWAALGLAWFAVARRSGAISALARSADMPVSAMVPSVVAISAGS